MQSSTAGCCAWGCSPYSLPRLVGWLMYLLGECCADCSNVIHDPPSYRKSYCDFLYLEYTQSPTLSSLLLHSFLGSSLFSIIIFFTVHFSIPSWGVISAFFFIFHFMDLSFLFHFVTFFAFGRVICVYLFFFLRCYAIICIGLMMIDDWWWSIMTLIACLVDDPDCLMDWYTVDWTQTFTDLLYYWRLKTTGVQNVVFNAVNFQKLFNFAAMNWSMKNSI